MASSCGQCGADGADKLCSRCRSAFYCSADCQAAAWKQHKAVCKRLAATAAIKADSAAASELQAAGKLAELPDVMRRLVKSTSVLQGIMGAETLVQKAQLATLLVQLGGEAELEEAESLSRSVLAAHEASSGPGDPSSLRTLHLLIRVLHGRALRAGAGDAATAILDESEKLLLAAQEAAARAGNSSHPEAQRLAMGLEVTAKTRGYVTKTTEEVEESVPSGQHPPQQGGACSSGHHSHADGGSCCS